MKRLTGEPNPNRKPGKSGRQQAIITCTACGLELYLCAAWGNADVGKYHLECRPKTIWKDL